MARRWQLNELAHAGAEHLDQDYVAAYDCKAGWDPSEDLALLARYGLNDTAVLVDIGAGTGALAVEAAALCRRVVAVDVSPAMLEAIRANAARHGLSNVEPVEGGFLSYTHRGGPADAVFTRNALHHLPDFWKALALERIAGILRPGGLLRLRDLVFCFEPDEADAAIEAWLEGAAERPGDGWTRAELEAQLREQHSTFSWLLEPMLEKAGFEIHEASYGATRAYAAYICVKAG